MDDDLFALQRLVESRRIREDFRSPFVRSRHGIRHGRCHRGESAPPRSGGKRGTQSQAIGRTVSGWATKILALTDALGNLVRFILIPGQHYDTVGVPALIEGVAFDGLIADKAFDINSIAEELQRRGAQIVIPQRKNRRDRRPLDRHTFKARHLIENFFAKLKEFKRVAMRSDKTDTAFKAMIYLVAAVINSR